MKISIKLVCIIWLGCTVISGCGKKQSAAEKTADSLAHCIADGIPSRAAAIQNAAGVTTAYGDTTNMR